MGKVGSSRELGGIVLAAALFAAVTASGKVIYVDTDAAGANDGTSWENAYNYLQDGPADANYSPRPVEIRVAKSTYRPDENTLHHGGAGHSDHTRLNIRSWAGIQ